MGFFTKIKRHSATNGESLTALYIPICGSEGPAHKKAQVVPLFQTSCWPQGVSGQENPLPVCLSITWTSTVCPHPYSHQTLEINWVLSKFLNSSMPCLWGKTATCCCEGAENTPEHHCPCWLGLWGQSEPPLTKKPPVLPNLPGFLVWELSGVWCGCPNHTGLILG